VLSRREGRHGVGVDGPAGHPSGPRGGGARLHPEGVSTDEICEALRSILDGHVYVPATLPDIRRAGGPRPKPAAASDELSRLTRRQREVLELITEGKSNKEIARALRLGEGTVKIHVAAVLQALSVPNRSAAAVAGTRMLHGRGLRG
jgi:DNA-binding NarL/FixJ family response regulator